MDAKRAVFANGDNQPVNMTVIVGSFIVPVEPSAICEYVHPHFARRVLQMESTLRLCVFVSSLRHFGWLTLKIDCPGYRTVGNRFTCHSTKS